MESPYGLAWGILCHFDRPIKGAPHEISCLPRPFRPSYLRSRMTRDQITENLRSLLRQQKQLKIDAEKISPESRIDAIGFDSITILDFVYDLEERFKVRIEMADLVGIRHVKDLIGYLEGKLAG
jgi:acyl carrier protein